MRRLLAIVIPVLLGALAAHHYFGRDQELVGDAAALIHSHFENLDQLETGYVLANAKAAAIRSEKVREQALKDIEALYSERMGILEEVDHLRRQALALMLREHVDLAALRSSRARAHELANQIVLPDVSAGLISKITELFESQEKTVARRVAGEVVRRVDAADKRAEEAVRQAAAANKRAEEMQLRPVFLGAKVTQYRCIACGAPATLDHADMLRCSRTGAWGCQCPECGTIWHAPRTPGTPQACPKCGNKWGFKTVG